MHPSISMLPDSANCRPCHLLSLQRHRRWRPPRAAARRRTPSPLPRPPTPASRAAWATTAAAAAAAPMRRRARRPALGAPLLATAAPCRPPLPPRLPTAARRPHPRATAALASRRRALPPPAAARRRRCRPPPWCGVCTTEYSRVLTSVLEATCAAYAPRFVAGSHATIVLQQHTVLALSACPQVPVQQNVTGAMRC